MNELINLLENIYMNGYARLDQVEVYKLVKLTKLISDLNINDTVKVNWLFCIFNCGNKLHDEIKEIMNKLYYIN